MAISLSIQQEVRETSVIRTVVTVSGDTPVDNPTLLMSQPTQFNRLCSLLNIKPWEWNFHSVAVVSSTSVGLQQVHIFIIVLARKNATIDIEQTATQVFLSGGASGAVLVPGPIGATGPRGATGAPGPAGTSSGGGASFAKVCTPEDFDAVGDGVTDDQSAFDAAYSAILAGTYNALVLGAKSYFLSEGYTVQSGSSLIGWGEKSVITSDQNIDIVKTDGFNHTLMNFRVVGSDSGANQVGIRAASNFLTAYGITVQNTGSDGIIPMEGTGGDQSWTLQLWDQIKVICWNDETSLYGINVQANHVTMNNVRVEADSCIRLDPAYEGFQGNNVSMLPAVRAVLALGGGRFSGGSISAIGAIAVESGSTQSAEVEFDGMKFYAGDINLSSNPNTLLFSGCPIYIVESTIISLAASHHLWDACIAVAAATVRTRGPSSNSDLLYPSPVWHYRRISRVKMLSSSRMVGRRRQTFDLTVQPTNPPSMQQRTGSLILGPTLRLLQSGLPLTMQRALAVMATSRQQIMPL